MNKLMTALLAFALVGLVACGDDDDNNTAANNTTANNTTANNTTANNTTANNTTANNTTANNTTANNTTATVELDTVVKIEEFIAGKNLLMEGENIPSDPNGFNENVNLDAATQCYNSTLMVFQASTFNVTTKLGVLEGAPMTGDVGTCNNDMVSTELTFTSNTHTITNIEGNAECFDFDVNYGSFAQEGRGMFVNNGAELHLELFFATQATGHRCADGAVGEETVTLNGEAFTGDAVQIYEVGAEL